MFLNNKQKYLKLNNSLKEHFKGKIKKSIMAILDEYLKRRLGILELQDELQRLINAYNKETGRYLFVYATDINKARTRGIDVSLVQEDFYNIQDILRECDKKTIDFYIETPGGSGEAAEEIAKFLRKKFNTVNFVIAGEAKSAGTILVLSGDNIYMTDTGSLGPIDAQIRIGRSVVSAHDYKECVDQKRVEANENGNLNPFDAVIVAQISPGELYGVINSLEFAKDLVKGWLAKYKFKNWTLTQSEKNEVTDEMKIKRANEVADKLCNHTEWRTHGRSLKIEDLEDLLLIERIDSDPKLADIVYRIKTVIRLIFDGSTTYKIYYLDNTRLARTFSVNPSNSDTIPIPNNNTKGVTQSQIEVIEIEISCPQCNKQHKVNGYFNITEQQLKNGNLRNNPNLKENDILVCDNCNFALDLKPIKSQIENQTKKHLLFK
jgi:hypothetical protein